MFRLNQLESVSRRGFIGGGVALGLIALKGASKAAGTTESLAEDDILAFVRTFNTTAVSLFASANYVGDYENKKGFFPDKRKMLVGMVDLLLENPCGQAWEQKFTPVGKEILPGWTLDYDASHEGHYVLIVRGTKLTVISDVSGVLYHALTPTTVPSAKDLMRADQFPGAIDSDNPLNVDHSANLQGHEN